MDNRPDFIVRRALASAAIALGALSLGPGAGPVAHAGVPLPVVAETTGMPSVASRPGGTLTVRAEMAERELGARSR
jgi:hypothetical protein